MSSAVDSVITALVAGFTAALPGVEVGDGPPVESPGVVDLVLVGHDQSPDADSAITTRQEWANLACTSRYETGEIPCCVFTQSGDTDIAARRTRAMQLLAACEVRLRADLSLGGVVMTSQLVAAVAHEYQNVDGSAVVVPFTVTYRAQV